MWREFQPSYVLLDGTTSAKLLNKPYFFLPFCLQLQKIFTDKFIFHFPQQINIDFYHCLLSKKKRLVEVRISILKPCFHKLQHCSVHFWKFAWGIKVGKVKQVMLNWPKKKSVAKRTLRLWSEIFLCAFHFFFLCTLLNHKCTLWCPPLL